MKLKLKGGNWIRGTDFGVICICIIDKISLGDIKSEMERKIKT